MRHPPRGVGRLRSDGQEVESTAIVISRIEGGKIAEDWANFDDLGLMRQLGAIPEPEEQAESW